MKTGRSVCRMRVAAMVSMAALLALGVVVSGCAHVSKSTLTTEVAALGDAGGAPVQMGAAGFAGRRQAAGVELAVAAPEAPPAPALAEKAAVPGGEGERQGPPIAAPTKGQKRLVIYTANFSILVANVDDSMKELLKKIEAWEGYIQTADLRRVTFRVPAAAFERAVEEIAKMGVVTNKQIQAEDVTRAYADLQLRIEVAEKSRKRLLDLLEKAQKTEDLLKIETEIRRLTEEIERMQAELRTLADRIAYSTITVELTAKAADVKRPRPSRAGSYFPWINQIGAEHVSRNF
ncbi:MAG: DUF4349 domain-containing protein [Candidatus Sumerlaeia bacterium]|nr:DUF4349 domain-containing protein [Candidatus Sumerlaeia bacterium]